VTSARPDEGKSIVAANLSEMIALSGSRALLVDCNPRNVGLTEQLAPKATAGLMDIVAGQATVKDLIWSDPVTTVEFLPAVRDPVPRDPNGKEDPAILCQRAQLAPAGLQKLLQSLEDRYDYVILDLPPITVADVKAISHLIDCFILVIEWGRTSRQIVIDALNTAPFVSEKLLGAVLNKADPAELRRLDS
jgi:succinoglycan biosynthesis transport protein ExoP